MPTQVDIPTPFQEEVFVVLEGTLTMALGDPPELYELCPRSIIVVHPDTPLKVANTAEQEAVFFVYSAPAEREAVILEQRD